ncbi:hypothetical protein BJ085DRAFT_27196 [Dimargaris cristalligena]|uniref:Uncharacterized protein n=1 Tax=Dimargaris cristalligena TaxID=215637 RepID=A0A4Q0A1S5_9FUNG|nr:hypothetical protein BJ085DRAFT_27196 [Dimargaris cristalligena]|eukprot:RKP40035.1 hypothetical protein BJ085DRAFT_27196 [Dimargaris cristalligena]
MTYLGGYHGDPPGPVWNGAIGAAGGNVADSDQATDSDAGFHDRVAALPMTYRTGFPGDGRGYGPGAWLKPARLTMAMMVVVVGVMVIGAGKSAGGGGGKWRSEKSDHGSGFDVGGAHYVRKSGDCAYQICYRFGYASAF